MGCGRRHCDGDAHLSAYASSSLTRDFSVSLHHRQVTRRPTATLRRQAMANASGPKFPVKQGKYREFVQKTCLFAVCGLEIRSGFNEIRVKFPTRDNREFFRANRELSGRALDRTGNFCGAKRRRPGRCRGLPVFPQALPPVLPCFYPVIADKRGGETAFLNVLAYKPLVFLCFQSSWRFSPGQRKQGRLLAITGKGFEPIRGVSVRKQAIG
jgi:hypothetical protein